MNESLERKEQLGLCCDEWKNFVLEQLHQVEPFVACALQAAVIKVVAVDVNAGTKQKDPLKRKNRLSPAFSPVPQMVMPR
jgi:hypothetical protein